MKITLGLDSTSLTRRYPRLAHAGHACSWRSRCRSASTSRPWLLFPFNTPERLRRWPGNGSRYDLATSPYRYLVYAVFLLARGRHRGHLRGGVRRGLDLGRAPRGRPHAEPHRPQPHRRGGLPGLGGRRGEDDPQGGHHSRLRRPTCSSARRRTSRWSACSCPSSCCRSGRASVVADMNVGVFYLTAMTAFVVVGHPGVGLGVELEVGAVRRHPRRRAGAVLRDPGRHRPDGAGADGGYAVHARASCARKAGRPGNGSCSRTRPPSSRSSSPSPARWPRATARPSICPRPSPSWSPATTPSTRASAWPSS